MFPLCFTSNCLTPTLPPLSPEILDVWKFFSIHLFLVFKKLFDCQHVSYQWWEAGLALWGAALPGSPVSQKLFLLCGAGVHGSDTHGCWSTPALGEAGVASALLYLFHPTLKSLLLKAGLNDHNLFFIFFPVTLVYIFCLLLFFLLSFFNSFHFLGLSLFVHWFLMRYVFF